ncbi:MAG: hypothetical protein L6R38_009210 [Xanthoria sp. 2 TBL-2021]|nr:MAG: hypothetical protein L6R38_009210 [Xanthoria sp. 2 TBL-2021]
MESAGLAIGVAGLAGLFSACVDCFEYIQLGRQFGHDYGKCLLKLDAARLQLSRWGASIGLSTVNSSLQRQLVASATSQEMRLAEDLLRQILDTFEDAKRIAARYTGYVSASTTGSSTDLVVYDADTADINSDFQRVHHRMRELAQQRQKTIGIRKKAKWALYEKKRFDRMIEDVMVFINQLVNLFPAAEDNQRGLCKLEVEAFQKPQELALLNDAAQGDDEILSGEIKRQMETRGHVVTNYSAGGNTSTFIGDDIAFGVEGKSHTFNGFSASGNAVVRLGNIYRGA